MNLKNYTLFTGPKLKHIEKEIDNMLDSGDRKGKLAGTMTTAKVIRQALEMNAVSAITTEENLLTSLTASVEVKVYENMTKTNIQSLFRK